MSDSWHCHPCGEVEQVVGELDKVALCASEVPLKGKHFTVRGGVLRNPHCTVVLEQEKKRCETPFHQSQKCDREVLGRSCGNKLTHGLWSWIVVWIDVERGKEGIVSSSDQEWVARRIVEEA